MDIFVFASKSETQGMVITEVMAAGVPVVALDAPGVREVVKDFENGRLIAGDNENEFDSALSWVMQDAERLVRLKQTAIHTAQAFGIDACASKALDVYI